MRGKRTKGRVLSLSIWRDEKSVVRWRTQPNITARRKRGGSRFSMITGCVSAR